MTVLNNDFNIPYYLLEEIIEYYKKGKPLTKWNNVVALMNLAKMNNRLTSIQVEQLKILCK